MQNHQKHCDSSPKKKLNTTPARITPTTSVFNTPMRGSDLSFFFALFLLSSHGAAATSRLFHSLCYLLRSRNNSNRCAKFGHTLLRRPMRNSGTYDAAGPRCPKFRHCLEVFFFFFFFFFVRCVRLLTASNVLEIRA